MMKHKKHNKIVKNFDKQKKIHLENLANKILKKDEKSIKLKEKTIDTKFLDLF
jgi:hypothetical protein